MRKYEEIEEILDEIADNCKTKQEYLTIMEDLLETIQCKITAADDIDW